MSEPKVKIITNKQWWLNIHDFIKAGVMTMIGTALQIIVASYDNGSFTFEWKQVKNALIFSGLTYLLKNFGTASNTTVKIKHDTPAINEGESSPAAQVNIDLSTKKPTVTTSVG